MGMGGAEMRRKLRSRSFPKLSRSLFSLSVAGSTAVVDGGVCAVAVVVGNSRVARWAGGGGITPLYSKSMVSRLSVAVWCDARGGGVLVEVTAGVTVAGLVGLGAIVRVFVGSWWVWCGVVWCTDYWYT